MQKFDALENWRRSQRSWWFKFLFPSVLVGEFPKLECNRWAASHICTQPSSPLPLLLGQLSPLIRMTCFPIESCRTERKSYGLLAGWEGWPAQFVIKDTALRKILPQPSCADSRLWGQPISKNVFIRADLFYFRSSTTAWKFLPSSRLRWMVHPAWKVWSQYSITRLTRHNQRNATTVSREGISLYGSMWSVIADFRQYRRRRLDTVIIKSIYWSWCRYFYTTKSWHVFLNNPIYTLPECQPNAKYDFSSFHRPHRHTCT